MQHNRPITFLAALLLLPFTAFAQPKNQPKPPADVTFTPNITYGKAGDIELKFNLAKPAKHDENSPPAPAIVLIHGGAWRAGHRDHHNAQAWQFAQRGYVAITVSYRFCPEHVFPAQVHDVKCAVRYLRAHAKELNINPDRIGAVGFSAGAHLSMLLNTMNKDDGLEGDSGWPDVASKVNAAVAFFGPTDMPGDDLPPVTQGLIKDFLGGLPKDKPEAYKQSSPLTYVDATDGPMLLFQGTKDVLVPHTQAFKMIEAMTKANVKGRVEILVGAAHGWGGKELEHTFEQMFKFFDEQLKKK
ncbi:MAG: alpha/beta hydrolase [Phycisphaeraceae bacterium]